MVVGTGIVAETGWTNVCFWTVIRPPEAAAKDCIWPNTQSVAAPMPRFGSVWLDAVCRVPKLTSFRIVALIRAGSMSRSIARRAGSGAWRLSAGSVSARAVPLSRGTATAVAAEAERNARRVAPPRPRTSLFSMPNIINALRPAINANTQMSTWTASGQRNEPVDEGRVGPDRGRRGEHAGRRPVHDGLSQRVDGGHRGRGQRLGVADGGAEVPGVHHQVQHHLFQVLHGRDPAPGDLHRAGQRAAGPERRRRPGR